MLPYVLLILIPGLLSYIAVDKNKIYIGTTQRVQHRNLTLPVFFIIFYFMLACRAPSIGNDTSNYIYYFDRYRQVAFWAVPDLDVELFYGYFNWLIGAVTNNAQIFLALAALVSLYPIAWLYSKNRQHSFLMMVLFVNLPIFIMLFSGIRQCMAIAIGVYAYHFVCRKKPIAFVLTVIAAMQFHRSAFILLPMYPLYYMNFKRKHLFVILPVIAAVYTLNNRIFSVIGMLMSGFLNEYSFEITETNAYSMLILFFIFLLFSYIIPGKNNLDRETMGLRNLLIMVVILQCFVPLHSLAMRLNYYYLVFVPLAISKVIQNAAEKHKQIAKISVWTMSVFFAAYFFIGIYQGALNGTGKLNTVPYIPFWSA